MAESSISPHMLATVGAEYSFAKKRSVHGFTLYSSSSRITASSASSLTPSSGSARRRCSRYARSVACGMTGAPGCSPSRIHASIIAHTFGASRAYSAEDASACNGDAPSIPPRLEEFR